MTPIQEMVVLVEPDCVACVRVLHTAGVLRDRGIVTNLVVLNRIDDSDHGERSDKMDFDSGMFSKCVTSATNHRS